jgi:hypothetical protein
MSKHTSIALGDMDAVEVSPNVGNVESLEAVVAVAAGTFVATYSIEGSIDGTTWAAVSDIHGNSLAGLTAPTARQLPVGYKQIRMNCTAYTSGTITGSVGGLDADVRG